MTRGLWICKKPSASFPQTSTACEFEKPIIELQVWSVVTSSQGSVRCFSKRQTCCFIYTTVAIMRHWLDHLACTDTRNNSRLKTTSKHDINLLTATITSRYHAFSLSSQQRSPSLECRTSIGYLPKLEPWAFHLLPHCKLISWSYGCTRISSFS